jgi:hypothetical protein
MGFVPGRLQGPAACKGLPPSGPADAPDAREPAGLPAHPAGPSPTALLALSQL